MAVTRNVQVDEEVVQVTDRDPSIASSPRCCHTGGNPASISTDGNDTTPSATETYFAEVFVPDLVTVTGIALFNGSAAAGNVTLALFDAANNLLRKTASTAQSGTDAYQSIALASTVQIPRGTYYFAAQFDDTNARFNSHVLGKFGAGKATSTTYGTFSGFTMPTTFTTALGPIASLY